MKWNSVFEMVRMAADIIIFAAALTIMFYFVGRVAEAIDMCLPIFDYYGVV
jgi:hypothetical protein